METYSCSLPIGPIHPAFKEPVRLTFELEGERIKDVKVRIGWLHRGIEYLGMRRNPIKTIYLAERICGICSNAHPLALVRAVENAVGMEVPKRAQYIRVFIAELERIHSHMLWAGVLAHEMGFDSLLFYTWKVRERIMDIIEHITGNRVNYAMLMFGGVRRDIDQEGYKLIKDAINYYREAAQSLKETFLEDQSVRLRTKGVGVITKKEALELSAVGPTARSTGIAKDVRQDSPYEAYVDLKVKAITPDIYTHEEPKGDVYDATVVRVLEVEQSVNILDAIIDNLPEGPIVTEPNLTKLLLKLKKAKGEGIGRAEAPRGEVIHYARLEGTENLHAWRARAPTYANVPTWIPMFRDQEIADIPVIAASIDPCIACMDRVTLVDIKTKKETIVTGEDLHRMSIEKTKKIRGAR